MDAATSTALAFDGYTLDPPNFRLMRDGAEVPLRPKAFAVLCCLIAAAPNVVRKEQLIDAVWPDVVVGEDSLVQCVREIRIALRDEAQTIVRTVPRCGYAFTLPVRALSAPALRTRVPRAWHARAAVLLAAAGVVLLSGDDGAAVTSPDASSLLTLAVLPLRNLSGDIDQDYLAEALTADLSADLTRLPNSLVTARASAARYRDGRHDSRRIGAELGVRYLVQGDLRRLGDAVRLNLTLLEAESGRQLWVARFDEPIDRITQLQREVTSSLARTLQVRLADVESSRRLREHASGPQAEDLALRGWYLWQQQRPESVARARELLLQAVQRDAAHARAWAWLALTYVSDLTNDWIDLRTGHHWAEWLQQADAASKTAVRLDPDLPDAIGARAGTLMLQGHSQEAIALRERQLAAVPNDPIAHHALAFLALHTGHPDLVQAHEQQALRVSPLDPRRHQMLSMIALAELHQRHDRQALDWAEKAVAVNPDYGAGYGYVASAAAHLGEGARARAALAEFRRLLPGHRLQRLQAEFDVYSTEPAYRAGQAHFYDGLSRAGLER